MSGAIIPDDWDEVSWAGYVINIPDSAQWAALVRGALSGFQFDYFWDKDTGDVDGAVSAGNQLQAQSTLDNRFPIPYQEIVVMAVPVGTVLVWPGPLSTIPDTYRDCDGDYLDPTAFPELFAAIGYTWGQLGVAFRLPQPANRFILAVDNVTGNTDLADIGGASTVALSTSELPAHQHGMHNHYSGDAGAPFGSAGFAVGAFFKQGTGTYYGQSQTGSLGSGSPHQNMPPYMAFNFIIKALPDT